MTRRFGIVLGLLAGATVAVPATFVQAETDDTEQSAFREAVKFGFSGEAIQGGVMIGDAPAGTSSLTFEGAPIPIDADGKFIIAFNRDAGQAANLVATLDNGQTVRQFINIAPRNWQIEHVSINRRATTRSAAFLALRGPELAQINAARSVHSDSKGWRESFIWPAKGRISGQFGSQRIYNGDPGSYHSTGCIQPVHAGRQSADDRPWHGAEQRVSAQLRDTGQGRTASEARPANRPDRINRQRHRATSALVDEME